MYSFMLVLTNAHSISQCLAVAFLNAWHTTIHDYNIIAILNITQELILVCYLMKLMEKD